VAAVIEVEGLRKEYRRVGRPPIVAIESLDLSVPEGGVFGFLGPNGSGKTTTIRCLLGLAAASGGQCRLLGVETPQRLGSVIRKVGAIVETPALYPQFSGRRNLALLGGLYGVGASDVTRALQRVGLAERADDKVKTYSLGMRQRLGLAAALLKDPALLILDEPANGLDPAGMVEMRRMLRGLADEGRTVFVSSHLLAEIQQTCDRVAILSRGACVANGAVSEVLAAGDRSRLRVRLDRADLRPNAEAALAANGYQPIPPDGDPALLVVPAPPTAGAHLNYVLGSAGVWASELGVEEVTLEDVFLQLTGHTGRDGKGLAGPLPAPPPPPPPTAPAPPQPVGQSVSGPGEVS
jgi:ABC-2 type transport system ATP-binding protein